MTKLHQKRFNELSIQLQELETSEKIMYGENIEGVDTNKLLEWKVKVRSLLSNVCGIESQYFRQFEKNESKPSSASSFHGLSHPSSCKNLLKLKAVFNAAREDFEGGYLSTTRSLVQAEVFDDELEQARELQTNGYSSAAAIVAGVVLETTLRELCTRAGISHGKLDKMNSDLAKAGVYNVLNQKRITTLADIRNSAAHGKMDKFTPDDVDTMIRDVEKFVADHVATI
jgi:hypothetical protein